MSRVDLILSGVGMIAFLTAAEANEGAIAAPPADMAVPQEDRSFFLNLEKQALPDLIHSLAHAKKTTHVRFLGVVGDARGTQAGAYLVEAYAHSASQGVRCKLLEGIGRLHDPTLLPWLAERLNDPHIGIQCFAIWAMGELRSSQAAERLRPKLWSPDTNVQMTAMDALSKCGPDPAIAAQLMIFLHDNDVQLRFVAAQSLSGIAAPEAVPELLACLARERSLDVQEALAQTVGRIGGKPGAEHLIALLKSPHSPATEHWIEVALKAVPLEILIPAMAPAVEGSDFVLKLSLVKIMRDLDISEWDTKTAGWLEIVRAWATGPDDLVQEGALDLLATVELARRTAEQGPL